MPDSYQFTLLIISTSDMIQFILLCRKTFNVLKTLRKEFILEFLFIKLFFATVSFLGISIGKGSININCDILLFLKPEVLVKI